MAAVAQNVQSSGNGSLPAIAELSSADSHQMFSQKQPSDNLHRLSAAQAVSRFFCFGPHAETSARRLQDLERSMSSFPSQGSTNVLPDLLNGSSALAIALDSAASLEEALPTVKVAGTSAALTKPSVVYGKTSEELSPELPFDIVIKILGYCDTRELKIAHQVSKSWSAAVRLNLRHLAPSSLDAARIKAFPMVEYLGVEKQTIQRNELSELSWLKSLGLKDCTFKHPISDLASLAGLEKLKLKDVEFGEPDGLDACRLIQQLPELTHLEVSRSSELLYCMPSFQLKSLEKLQSLVLLDAGLGSRMTHLTQLSSLTALVELSVSKAIVDFDIARSIGSCTQLERLELSDVSLFNNASMNVMSELTNLTRLDLRTIPDGRSEIEDGISVIGQMTRLQYLNLAGHASLAYQDLSVISSLKDLKNLSLSGLDLGDYGGHTGPSFLSSLTALTALNLYGTLIKARHFEVLQHMKFLKTLDCSHTYLDARCTPHIAAMKDLGTLKLNYCPVSNIGLHTITAGCPSLTYLRTDGCWISTLGMLTAMLQRPGVIFWSKSSIKSEMLGKPVWYRKLEVVVCVRVQPGHMSLRSLWVKERTIPITVGVAVGVAFTYVLWMILWLFVLLAVSIAPALGALVYALVVPPVVFFKRILEGGFKKSRHALPDAFDWLYHKLFPVPSRTAEDRLAELV